MEGRRRVHLSFCFTSISGGNKANGGGRGRWKKKRQAFPPSIPLLSSSTEAETEARKKKRRGKERGKGRWKRVCSRSTITTTFIWKKSTKKRKKKEKKRERRREGREVTRDAPARSLFLFQKRRNDGEKERRKK